MTARLRPALGAGTLAVALALGAVGTAGTATAGPADRTRWVAVELGTLGGDRTVPTAVNDHGQVVGRSQVADGRWHAFLWDDGVLVDLTPDAQDATATDVSDRGHVAGWAQPVPGAESQAFVWRDGVTTVVAEGAYGLAVNERGQVAGVVDDPGTWSANSFVWTAGRRVDLPPPPFDRARTSASLVDLNDRGDVLASGERDDDSDLVYVWRRGRFTEVRGAVDGPVRPADLNDRGEVAGSVARTGRLREAALWRDGAVVRLGVLPGTESSRALALNDRGVVVGVSEPEPGARGTAFVWHDGVLEPVAADAGWSVASEVNERGQVAGQLGATRADGVDVAQPFVWARGVLTPLGRPVAEPVTVVDLGERGHVVAVVGGLLAERGVLWVPSTSRS